MGQRKNQRTTNGENKLVDDRKSRETGTRGTDELEGRKHGAEGGARENHGRSTTRASKGAEQSESSGINSGALPIFRSVRRRGSREDRLHSNTQSKIL